MFLPEKQNCSVCTLKTKIGAGTIEILQMNHRDAVVEWGKVLVGD